MGEELHSLREIDEAIQNQKSTFQYSLSETILFLLYADAIPIKGKVRQMKEVFFMLKEVFDKLSVEPIQFEKNRFGPYSEEVELAIDQLAFFNCIELSGKRSTNEFSITITPKGVQYIEGQYRSLSKETRDKLVRKRKEWDTLTTQGIMELVYTHYPEFLEKSVFKKRYETLDWENDEQRPIKK